MILLLLKLTRGGERNLCGKPTSKLPTNGNRHHQDHHPHHHHHHHHNCRHHHHYHWQECQMVEYEETKTRERRLFPQGGHLPFISSRVPGPLGLSRASLWGGEAKLLNVTSNRTLKLKHNSCVAAILDIGMFQLSPPLCCLSLHIQKSLLKFITIFGICVAWWS